MNQPERPVRSRIARSLVSLTARLDHRPGVCYEIKYHTPLGWEHPRAGRR